MLQPGTRLGPYEITSFLAKGGMGEVYIARDHRLDRDIAIKILSERQLDSPDSLARFEREAKALAALSHPNILTIYDVGIEKNVSFVVMELLTGESLRVKILRQTITGDEALNVAISIADGLEAAHLKGIIHRDLKPENIFITEKNRVKILDFGLARFRVPFESEMLQTITSMSEFETEAWATKTGSLIGTVPYMSPEQIRGRSIDARSDIFSTGILFYEMTSGIHPFGGKNLNEVITNILNGSVKAYDTLNTRIAPSLEPIIKRCLEKDPENRYSNATELLNDLRNSTVKTEIKARTQSKILLWMIPALAVVLIVFSFLYRSRSASEPVHSIAILPLLNRSVEPDTEYLSDGITDRIIRDISRVPNLKVMGSGTVFGYKGKQLDPRKIGNELDVDAVATGSIARQGNMLIVQVEMVKVADGAVLWADQYNRPMSGLLEIQADVSNKISQHLKLKLTGQQIEKISEQTTKNSEAFELYLRGRYLWTKFNPADQTKSIEYFKRALEKDPSYAVAWAGLSDAYGSMATNGWLQPSQAYPLSKAAAQKAISLQPQLAEAHQALGATLFFYERDWNEAEKELKEAISLNPNYIDAYCVYSYLLSSQGHVELAIPKIHEALELDPLNLKTMSDLSYALYLARDFDGSLAQISKVLEMNPNHEPVLNTLVYLYSHLGKHDQAIQSGLKALNVSHGSAIELATLGYAYGVAGQKEEAKKIIEQLKDKAEKNSEYISDFYFGHVYAGLGQKDLAFEFLMKACSNWQGDWGMLFINAPYSDSLRHDPRFEELARCMKLQS